MARSRRTKKKKRPGKRRRRGRSFRVLVGLAVLAAVGGLLAFVLWPELSAGSAGRTSRREVDPSAISIFLTASLQGRIVPCRCEEGELGGLARAATAFKEWNEQRPEHILVDVGSASLPSHPQAELVRRHVFEALDRLGCAVVNCGTNEVTLPPKTLAQFAEKHAFEFISANLIHTASREPVLRPSCVVARAGLRVGFVGLVDDAFEWADRPENLRLAPCEEALRRELPKLEEQADAIVVLAFAEPERLYELARQFPQVTAFIGGRTAVSSGEQEFANASAIAYLGDEGCSVGRLDLEPREDGPPLSLFHTRLLDDDVASDPAMGKLVAQFNQQLGDAPRPDASWNPKMPCTGSYVGSDVCALCHAKEFYRWYGSAHAGAYVSLLQKRKHNDKTCLPCHTTGYGQPGGYDPEQPTAPSLQPKEVAELQRKQKRRLPSQHPLKGVGCECCHGGARRHLGEALLRRKGEGTAETNLQLRPPSALRNCQTCHNPDRPCLPADAEDSFSSDAKLQCLRCEGSGRIKRKTCKKCEGTGRTLGVPCDQCDGSGKIGGDPCPRCDASGRASAREQYLEMIRHWGDWEQRSALSGGAARDR
jgi:hypothetical protein